jgi:hypothetical protein
MEAHCQTCRDNAITDRHETIRNWLADAMPTSAHLVDEQIRRDLWRKQVGTAEPGAWS